MHEVDAHAHETHEHAQNAQALLILILCTYTYCVIRVVYVHTYTRTNLVQKRACPVCPVRLCNSSSFREIRGVEGSFYRAVINVERFVR